MVTRGTPSSVRIKFLVIFKFAILSVFSLIANDDKISDEKVTTSSNSEMRHQREDTHTLKTLYSLESSSGIVWQPDETLKDSENTSMPSGIKTNNGTIGIGRTPYSNESFRVKTLNHMSLDDKQVILSEWLPSNRSLSDETTKYRSELNATFLPKSSIEGTDKIQRVYRTLLVSSNQTTSSTSIKGQKIETKFASEKIPEEMTACRVNTSEDQQEVLSSIAPINQSTNCTAKELGALKNVPSSNISLNLEITNEKNSADDRRDLTALSANVSFQGITDVPSSNNLFQIVSLNNKNILGNASIAQKMLPDLRSTIKNGESKHQNVKSGENYLDDVLAGPGSINRGFKLEREVNSLYHDSMSTYNVSNIKLQDEFTATTSHTVTATTEDLSKRTNSTGLTQFDAMNDQNRSKNLSTKQNSLKLKSTKEIGESMFQNILDIQKTLMNVSDKPELEQENRLKKVLKDENNLLSLNSKNDSGKSINQNEFLEESNLKNASDWAEQAMKVNRKGKNFISEETLMESRNYNYDPLYPSGTYDHQPLSGNPTASGEDTYQHGQTFATITRDFWPNYQQPQDIATYPALTTVKTPRAHTPPPYHVENTLKKWRFPFFGYRQPSKLRGTYPKDEATFYDYFDDTDIPLESMNMHRWSNPHSGQSGPTSSGSNANIGQIRPEFHRYHEGGGGGGGGGGYDYSPHYDFAHVHEHEAHDTGYKLDFTKIGLLFLLKLAILKLKSLGALQILLLLLLKAKLLLAMMALKFFMVLKALKLAKYLLAPLALMSLLPMLLMAPLGLLSALLPLLMMLFPQPNDDDEPDDIPDIPDPPDNPDEPDPVDGRRRKKKKHRSIESIQRVLRSENCLQRIGCELAAKRQFSLISLIVNWSLQKLAKLIPIPPVKAYAKAYTIGRKKDRSSPKCSSQYKCNYFKKRSFS